ncbi:peptide MFS transporter [Peptostreptococcus equinus]|uniref:Peptide MFS transporter n=1 Tax=Peptostreptococcus equinus TaxID=3003601 RepID=A0ABY7JNE6_9FIRM|nr:peptide MFS transporter [Peptostreptococcus sp. CBA3647]WAW14862.1 peptide MFS transporter [Peptostreptococcus sp. CBA3647]
METSVKKTKYPLGFYISCLTYTFERFAFYGSKPLLILFLITAVAKGGLGINEAEAAIITVNFTAWTYIAPVVGGFICDKWLGARYAVSIGCLLMGLGYLIGWKADSVTMVNMMIAVVSVGTGLFKGNLAGIIGRLFDDPEILDTAFSVQYSFVNIGAMLGSALMGYLYMTAFMDGKMLGFRTVFLVCAILVFLGGIFFTLSYKTLRGQGIKPFKYFTDVNGKIIGEEPNETKEEIKEEAAAPLTKLEKNRVALIVFISFVSIIFWLFYEQQSVSLTIYMSKYVDMTVGGFRFSEAHVSTTWNGLLCVFLSLAAAKLWARLAKRPQGDMSMFHKVTWSFVFLGLSYLILVFMEMSRGVGAPETVKTSVLWLFAFGFVLTLGEICFSPLGNSFVSKYAPKKYLSLLLGVWLFATFAANKLSGYVEGFIVKLGIMNIFITFTIVSFITAAIMFVLSNRLTKLLDQE